MFANAHGWIVRPRFRTTCGMIKQSSVHHALKSSVAHGCIGGYPECGRLDMPARAWGMLDEMMLTACPRWDYATMIAVLSGGTYRTGTCRRHASEGSCMDGSVMPDSIVSLPSSGWFQKKSKISKKNRRCHYCTVFSFFSRASPRWRRTIPEARRGMPETAICTWFVLVAGTYRKMRTYCRYLYVHIVSEAMVLSKPEWDGFLRWFLLIVIIEEVWTLTLSSLVSSVNRSWCMMV